MRRAWTWIAAGILVAIAIVVALALLARGKKGDANRAFADGVEAWSRPRIDKKLEQLRVLKTDVAKNAEAIKLAEADVDKERVNLEAKYADLDLSPAEIADRTKTLRI